MPRTPRKRCSTTPIYYVRLRYVSAALLLSPTSYPPSYALSRLAGASSTSRCEPVNPVSQQGTLDARRLTLTVLVHLHRRLDAICSCLEARTRQRWPVPDEDQISAYLAPSIASSTILTVSHLQGFIRHARAARAWIHRSRRCCDAARGRLQVRTRQQEPIRGRTTWVRVRGISTRYTTHCACESISGGIYVTQTVPVRTSL